MTPADPETKTSQKRSRFERLLGVFAEVRAGEAAEVLLMFANIFLILTAYYILKVVREALTIGGVQLFGLGGDEIKAYLPAVMMVLLLAIVPLYGKLASAVSRIRLLNSTTAFVIVTLVLFWLWGNTTGIGTAIGLSFYVYLGIMNVFLIAQFWSFANDIYSEAQGKRLFAIIATGQSLGAVLGPWIAEQGADQVFSLLLVSAAIFCFCILLYNVVDRRSTTNHGSLDDAKNRGEEPLDKEGGFQLVFQSRYLFLIALMILVTNIVNTTGEYILSNAAKAHSEEIIPDLSAAQIREADATAEAMLQNAEATNLEEARLRARDNKLRLLRSEEIGRFYGRFFFWVNFLGVTIQMFAVSRILKFFGVRAALFFLPLISFGGYAAIALTGALGVLRLAKTAENSVDYSLQNTVKQALFLPTSREAKYKAKAAIDTFFVRFGDTVSAALIFAGLHFLHFSARSFAWLNIALVLAWVALNVGIAREHKKMSHDEEAEED